jgi:hypothetical protein
MDPLSIAASVAGLIGLVGGVAQLSRELYSLAKEKPDYLRRLAKQLDSLHGVLEELKSKYQHAVADSQEEDGALKTVTDSCEATLRRLQRNLDKLRSVLTKYFRGRLRSRSHTSFRFCSTSFLWSTSTLLDRNFPQPCCRSQAC